MGAGIAGLAAAALLCKSGHRCEIFERLPTLGNPGAGLLLQPSGMAVLGQIGVLERVLSCGSVITRLEGRTASNRLVLDAKYADLSGGGFGLGVHRGMLFEALLAAALDSGATITAGTDIAGMAESEGVVLVTERGARLGGFDLAVLADGARSRLRPGVAARPYPWGALWFVGELPSSLDPHVLRQVYADTRRMVGFLPSGRLKDREGPELVSMFWSVRADRVAAVRAGELEAWKSAVRALTPIADPLLAQIDSLDQLIYAPYFDLVLKPMHRGRAVWIGDAAHAMSPQLGQGANLGLLDASLLAGALASGEPLGSALKHFSRERASQVGYYSRVSRALTPWFQSDYFWLAPIRDIALPLACRMKWSRRELLLALAGVKSGLFSSSPVPHTPAPAR